MNEDIPETSFLLSSCKASKFIFFSFKGNKIGPWQAHIPTPGELEICRAIRGVDRRLCRMDCESWVYRCEPRGDEAGVEERDPCAHTEQSSSTWSRLLKHLELQIWEVGSHVS